MDFGRLVKVVAAVAALGFAGQASAVSLACNVTDASANGATANACAGVDNNGNPTFEAGFATSSFGGNAFIYADKTGENGLAGWELLVSTATPPSPYPYTYQLNVPVAMVGQVVDFVLSVKQGNNTFQYLFNSVTLGVSGGFFSLAQLNSTTGAQDFSHVTALYRPGTPRDQVPEPGTLALLGLGLVALGAARRRV